MIILICIGLLLMTFLKREVVLNILRTKKIKRYYRLLNIEDEVQDKTLCMFWVLSLVLMAVISLKIDYYSLVIGCLFMGIPYYKMYKKVKNKKEQIDYEFPIWMNHVRCLLQTNTVLNTLEKSYQQAPELIKNDLRILIEKLEFYPNNLRAFEEFLLDFDNWNIKTSMHYLYRHNFVACASAGDLLHLNQLISGWLNLSRQRKQKKYLNQRTYIAFLPMLVVSFLFMFMMYLVMSQMLEGGCCS